MLQDKHARTHAFTLKSAGQFEISKKDEENEGRQEICPSARWSGVELARKSCSSCQPTQMPGMRERIKATPLGNVRQGCMLPSANKEESRVVTSWTSSWQQLYKERLLFS